jgi:phosphoglycolate phosphatase-like HAD superfamily hydrolase
MKGKRLLLVLDFDGFLLNSYALIQETMSAFGLDVGDEDRFRNRRKFLKYLGGGREIVQNLVRFALPGTRRLRQELTSCYREKGRLYPEFGDLLNAAIRDPRVHCGIVSRNFTLEPGPTIRTVLRRSGVDEAELDFLIPIPVGVRKDDVLAGMRSDRYHRSLLGADEIGDFRAGASAGYECLIGSYGFDTSDRLVRHGEVPESCIYESPSRLAQALRACLGRESPRVPVAS